MTTRHRWRCDNVIDRAPEERRYACLRRTRSTDQLSGPSNHDFSGLSLCLHEHTADLIVIHVFFLYRARVFLLRGFSRLRNGITGQDARARCPRVRRVVWLRRWATDREVTGWALEPGP